MWFWTWMFEGLSSPTQSDPSTVLFREGCPVCLALEIQQADSRRAFLGGGPSNLEHRPQRCPQDCVCILILLRFYGFMFLMMLLAAL